MNGNGYCVQYADCLTSCMPLKGAMAKALEISKNNHSHACLIDADTFEILPIIAKDGKMYFDYDAIKEE